ncbi:hypothetical protein SmJEL517_g06102 [Synchytrium microbalum]|uniref:Mitochondrial carrier domain-containing protein n=1 Tax=Synchytrium microbalum TaxID=1806994 RepID=A0A507BYG3_9FUNG|nr:uncharacterized protein SmJEL517_g06102 [Synchytrium microbalum]TPX30313.1 hypothetical protein SmJEL517_g06102 [Synchytrium microbalum]
MADAKVAAPPKPLPMHWNLVAGAIAGVSEIITMYPLDVVKTRFQLQVGPEGYKSIADAFSTMVKNEGFGVLYRGIIPPIMVEAPKRAIKFGANEKYGQLYKEHFGMKPGQAMAIATGISAGCTEAMVVVSFDLVKIRLQDKNNAGKYKNTTDAVAKIFAEEGFLGFWKGLEATLWRHALWNGGYFGSINYVRGLLPKAESKQGTLVNNFVAGSIGGTIGTILNTPFDVVKSRVQNQGPGKAVKYNWGIPALGIIVREEGFKALYKGFVPKVLRLGPGGGILLVVFDFVSDFIRKNLL